MLRVKIIKSLCRVLRLPEPFWEIHPVEPRDFATMSREIIGVPTYFDFEKMREALWPVPNHCPRIYLGW